jgi:hypothetical protein
MCIWDPEDAVHEGGERALYAVIAGKEWSN